MQHRPCGDMDTFFRKSGWSRSPGHARYIDENFSGIMEVGRSIIYFQKDGRTLKARPHHNGRDNRHITITDARGGELGTFTDAHTPARILDFVENKRCVA
jgi:hypothetical protein